MKNENKVYVFAALSFLLLALTASITGCVLPDKAVEPGDVVSVDYVGTFEDGSVFDTSIKEVAENPLVPKDPSFRAKNVYAPLKFTAGVGEVIPGFDDGVLGMKKGEKKEIRIPPEEAYGDYNKDLTRTLLRKSQVAVLEVVEKERFSRETGLTEFIENTTVPWRYWQGQIYKVLPELIVVRNEVTTERINTNIGSIDVTIESGTITMVLIPQLDTVISTPQGPAKVTFMNESEFILDYNHPLAGKTLVFEITVDSIEKVAS